MANASPLRLRHPQSTNRRFAPTLRKRRSKVRSVTFSYYSGAFCKNDARWPTVGLPGLAQANCAKLRLYDIPHHAPGRGGQRNKQLIDALLRFAYFVIMRACLRRRPVYLYPPASGYWQLAHHGKTRKSILCATREQRPLLPFVASARKHDSAYGVLPHSMTCLRLTEPRSQ